MANIIEIDIKTKTVRRSLLRTRKRLPEGISRVANQWGRILEKDLKNAARQAGIKDNTGTLFKNGIRWEMKPKGFIGKLFMRQYGIFLDSMTPHWVNITAQRTGLLGWASQAQSSLINNSATLISSGKIKKKSVFVKPHPFIRTGSRRARRKLPAMLRQTTQQIVAGG